jgi:hypothetical protein
MIEFSGRTGRTYARRSRLFAQAPLAIAVGVILWRLRDYFALHTLPMRGDPSLEFRAGDLTVQWVPWLRIATDALWRHGVLAFWDPFRHAGAPQFEVPQAGLISLSTLLGGLAPVAAAVKWSILAHIVLGMTGVYVFARRLHTSAPFAAIGALVFALGPYLLDHLYLGHLDHVYAMGLTPWVLVLVWTALVSDVRWWRPAVAAGVVLGIESLEGATSALVYSLMACCLVVVGVSCAHDPMRLLRRLIAVGAITAAAFFCTAAPQLLPMTNYIGVTGRGGGLTIQQSAAVVAEVLQPMPTIAAALLMIAGIGRLWSVDQRVAAVWLSAVAAVSLAAANLDAVYAFLWRYFPGIRYQRIPQRALVLIGVVGPVLAAAGAEMIWALVRRRRVIGRALAVVALGWFVYDTWSIAPGNPPMVDPRIERDRNHAMRWVAAHAQGSRVHVWEPPTRHWLPDNVTVPLGLETLTGATPSEHREYLRSDYDPPHSRTFLGDGYEMPARFWGLLNVRYVLATVPQSAPGFALAAHVAPCPIHICQPATSAGPYIYENRQWMPRAWMVRHAIALVGEPTRVFEAALDLLKNPAFDPAHVVVLQLSRNSELPQVDAVFPVETEIPGTFRWRTGGADATLAKLLRSATEPIEPAGYRRIGTNRIELHAPSDGWLVVSEKLPLYAGWTAKIRTEDARFFRANGVLAALRVRSGDIVRASYEPRGFRTGIALFTAMVVAIFVAARRPRSMRQRARVE